MRIDIISIFPSYLEPLRLSLLGRAVADGRVVLHVHDLRDWTHDRHRTVDDAPYGGGPGMVMKPEPWGACIDELVGDEPAPGTILIVPTPAGEPFRQATAQALTGSPHLILACGRYEGIDQRVVEHFRTRIEVLEASIGDYVLAGGEVAAMVIVEAVTRLLPGVLGNAESALDDSFASGTGGLLEAPVYTRPSRWRELAVPEVLQSGNHGAVSDWRAEQSRRRTRRNRPDLLAETRGDSQPE